MKRVSVVVLVLLGGFSAALTATPQANAAGLYFSDRGVRPLGRGGAFVAGADDLGAMWYNPAGLADAGNAFLFDGAWMNFSSDFTRKAQVIDGGGTVRTYDYPTVQGSTAFLPIPTLGFSRVLDKEQKWTFGGGILVPYGVIASYPRTVDGAPAASRYSLLSLDGSALVILSANLAYKVSDEFRIGFGLQTLVGKFSTAVMFNANPADRFVGAPEDPNYDANARIDVAPIITLPSVNLGAIWKPNPHLRFGISGFTPYYISSPGKVQVQLPNAAIFDSARQSGTSANVSFWLPPVARAGIEYRTETSKDHELRVEVSYVREFWSVHDEIVVTPKDINLVGVIGFPSPFPVAPIHIKRGFQDSNSIRIGGEFTVPGPFENGKLTFRAGGSFEDSAVPRDYVSPITIDTNKITVTAGIGIHVGRRWRFDGVFSHVFADQVVVPPGEAQIYPVNPVKGNPAPQVAINGGTYVSRATVLGIGLNYQFDGPANPNDTQRAPGSCDRRTESCDADGYPLKPAATPVDKPVDKPVRKPVEVVLDKPVETPPPPVKGKPVTPPKPKR